MSRLDPLLELVLPFAVVGVLVLLLRWTWSPRRGRSFASRTPRRGAPGDYGLLIPIAAPADPAETLLLIARLDAAGIRSTLVDTTQGPRLMVWPEEAGKARRVVGTPPG
ncbi:hypothetical protein ABIA33_005790 [Streptacidiphilus sp. MAP12-16]|uniref:hypothetical protein n=1 Tax=Streptacidiphilus sp. MAP12-16 TaxID=3156300 RepID=UPI003510F108